VGLLWLMGLCAGCAGNPTLPNALVLDQQLIDGSAVFGYVVPAAQPVDMLAMTPAMRAFVDEDVGQSQYSYRRFERLLKKMEAEGFFRNPYLQTGTYSAAETFAVRKGNCVAYTNLFIALARHARLKASYQLVFSPPSWDVQSGYLLRNNHINVNVRSLYQPRETSKEITVDFNAVQADDAAPRRNISDAYAASMFYANLSVQHLQADKLEKSFSFLKLAIQTEPANVDLWNNLGAFYSIAKQNELAQDAYRVALRLDGKNKTAFSGLATVLRSQGRLAEAVVYERLVAKYRDRNPYWHYAAAEQFFKNESFQAALESIGKAIALKRDAPRFYVLRDAIDRAVAQVEQSDKTRKQGHG